MLFRSEEVLVAGLAPGAEWRIELHRDRASADVLAITVEADDPARAGELAAVVHRRTLVRPEVRVVPPGTLERFGGKARRVTDLRPRD